VILGSSFFGAYSLIRGITMITGGFPHELLTYIVIKSGQVDEIEAMTWIYVGLALFLAIMGTWMQIGDRKKHLEMYYYKGGFTNSLDYKTLRS